MAHPSSSYKAHDDAILSIGNGKNKGKIRFPCRLCEGNHPLHLCPLMDKASAVLESLTASSPPFPVVYQRLYSNPLPVDKEINLDSCLVHPSLPKPGYAQPVLYQPLVRKSVDLDSPPMVDSVPDEHHDSTAHVLLVSSDSLEPENDPPIPTDSESPSSVPIEHGGNHMIPPPSSSVISFNWSCLTAFRLPSYMPFQITVHAYDKAVPGTVLDEGASVSLMPFTTW